MTIKNFNIFINNCFDLVEKMKSTDHSYDRDNLNPYHLEGDVWTHTVMVYNEAVKRGFNKLVQISALFHDIGKIDTAVRNENKRVSFRGHAGISAFKSLDYLKYFNLNRKEIITIFQMIAFHDIIFHDLEKISAMVDSDLLENIINLSICDRAGRVTDCSSLDQIIDYKVKDYKIEKNDSEKEIIMLIGLPASGKSSFLKDKDGFVISRDRIIHDLGGDNYNLAYNTVDMKLVDIELSKQKQQGLSFNKVYVDMTNMTKKRRNSLLNLYKNYKKTAIVFLVPFQELIKRKRINKNISEDVYLMMMKSFTPPTYDDFDQIDFIIDMNNFK